MSELTFCTTEELIAEIMRRKTFCGVIVHATDEQKREIWPDQRIFKVHYSENLDDGRAGRLLDTVAEYMELNS